MAAPVQPWNWNIHYHRLVLDAVRPGAETALDVGSGDGLLTFDLADRGLDVIGLDVDRASIERARNHPRASDRTRFVLGDLLLHPLEPASFDVVASIAMVHQVDAAHALRRMRQLVRPGGVVVVVGFARPDGPADRARALAGAVAKRAVRLRGRYWEHRAPTAWPPPHTAAEMKAIVDDELPGARFRRLLSGRYGVTWVAPA
jgi:SAM-dependent methyltransferase